MKVVLYMAMSTDGYIAKKNDETSWSKEEWQSFSQFVKEAGNLVVGRKTFEIMKSGGEFKKIGNPEVVVVSSKRIVESSKVEGAKSPEEAVGKLRVKGFSTIVVGGGSKLNASFMKAGLIDEIYLDIEPQIFGKGKPLFSEEEFECRLKLLGTKMLSKDTIQSHYKVLN